MLTDGIDLRLKELLLQQQAEYGYEVIEMEVMPDHVHLLLYVDPSVGVVHVIGHIKGYTAKVLREEFPSLVTRLPCLWTRSKFITTVGVANLETVKKYIERQKGV